MSAYSEAVTRAQKHIEFAGMQSTEFGPGRNVTVRPDHRGSLAIASAILALAEAIRPADVTVTVTVPTVTVDEVKRQVGDLLGGAS